MKQTNEMFLAGLQQGLRHFGLNPREWRIKPDASGWYQVISVDDDSFRFIGLPTELGNWAQLHLQSL